jgi:hypothetical protein
MLPDYCMRIDWGKSDICCFKVSVSPEATGKCIGVDLGLDDLEGDLSFPDRRFAGETD